MPRVARSIELPLSAEELYELLLDWSWHARWQPSLKSASSPVTLEVGSRVREVRVAFGHEAEAEFEIVALDRATLIRAASVAGPLAGVQEYAVEPHPVGARLTITFEVELPAVLRILEGMATPAMAEEADASLAGLHALFHPPAGAVEDDAGPGQGPDAEGQVGVDRGDTG